MESHSDSVYRNNVLQAIDFAWHHKRLWFLGVFAGFLTSGGVFEILVRGYRDIVGANLTSETLVNTIAPGAGFLTYIPDIITVNQLPPLTAVVYWILALGMVLAAFWFFSLCEGTLFAAVASPGDVSIARRVHDELPLTNRIIAKNLIAHLLLGGTMYLSVLPYALSQGQTGKAAAVALGFLIAIIATISITIVSIFTACGIALHKESLFVAIKKSFLALKSHAVILIEAALIYFVLSVIFVMAVTLILLLLANIFSAYGFLVFIFSLQGLSGLVSFGFLLVTLVFVLASLGFLVTFQYAAWAKLYEQVALGTARSAIHRYLVHPLRERFGKR
ncbi:MAG: hypothetical protein WCJ29_05735 [bacterium]